MTKKTIIRLEAGTLVVRIDHRRRGVRTEFPMVGQAAIRRYKTDFPYLDAHKSRLELKHLVELPATAIKTEKVTWKVERSPTAHRSGSKALIEPRVQIWTRGN